MLTKIFVVDDHDHMRRQLRCLIEGRPNWSVCCEAADGTEAVAKHGAAEPHVTVMDFNMPRMDGLKASRLILKKCPEAAILMVTLFASQQLCEEARKAGLKGICSKNEGEGIVEGIAAVLRGEMYFPERVH